MMFGEIVEPSTRALILDEDQELLEYKEPVFEWKGNPQPPDHIENLIFADSSKVVQICVKGAKNRKPLAEIPQEGLSIYKFDNNYIVAHNDQSNEMVIGELVELLSTWIKKAKSIHGLTSVLSQKFYPFNQETSLTFTRCLTTFPEVPFKFCKKLESPNLINGFSVGVLSYCISNNISATLWVVYTDNMPIDSVNCSEILRLIQKLGINVCVDFKAEGQLSNLYL